MQSSFGFAARSKRPAGHLVPYLKEALKQDLLRMRVAWDECQQIRDRDAVYKYLTGVFELVSWWAAENRALDRAHRALRLQNLDALVCGEPFAAVIFCTSDPDKVDKRTRSKWSRILRYAAEYKRHSEPLDLFIKRRGGINRCASRFSRLLGQRRGAILSI